MIKYEALSQACIGLSASLREAMVAIDRSALELALMLEANGRLCGILTDGDIRRALLHGAQLDDEAAPSAKTDFVSASQDDDRVWVLEKMQALKIRHVPVLDAEKRLVGLHLLRELVAPPGHDLPTLILAGGRGTRLHPVTESVPKPMLPVAGRPILERLVLGLVGQGVRRVFLAVNHLADRVEAHFGDGSELGCTISYLREDPTAPLGSAGALATLPPLLHADDREVLVLNGDLVLQLDLDALLAHHRDAAASMTIASHQHIHEVPFGLLQLSGDRVEAIVEKPVLSWPISAGVYIIDRSVLSLIEPGAWLPMNDLVDRCLAHGVVVAHPIDGDWIDVGRPEELERARGER